MVPKIVVTIVHLAAMHSTALVSTGSGRPCQRRLDGICGMVFRRGLPGCRRPKPYCTECFAAFGGASETQNLQTNPDKPQTPRPEPCSPQGVSMRLEAFSADPSKAKAKRSL